MPLKAGGLGLAGDVAPLPDEFADSMAAAMEVALNQLLEAEDRPPAPIDNTPESRDRRMLFVAIAQGVVNHLVENRDAFVVTTDGDPEPLNERPSGLLISS